MHCNSTELNMHVMCQVVIVLMLHQEEKPS